MHRKELAKPIGIGTGVWGATLLFLLAVAQWPMLQSLWRIDVLSVGQKWKFLIESVQLSIVVTPFDALVLPLIISGLSGVNAGLLSVLIARRRGVRRAGGGILAILAGAAGVGCASCGSVLIVSLLGLSAATPVLAVLPLKGFEFSIVSILLLCGICIASIRELRRPVTCPVELPRSEI